MSESAIVADDKRDDEKKDFDRSHKNRLPRFSLHGYNDN